MTSKDQEAEHTCSRVWDLGALQRVSWVHGMGAYLLDRGFWPC